ncbi:hypothetical protein HNO88_000527 [Novosphingobium chloroacetimidivorans]|uniref:Uncharacterized protein n=1 Tax=Novosphingobium chloroacetimidivorans TaxID=1428314 RepID=A0A7W7K780_9SPHN|nr:hypothetical protein [Novosphingobium chloroacetimidivorans]MBB4857220.1 hypothetical protein [Novosphingobium chloroacetimidivorans]
MLEMKIKTSGRRYVGPGELRHRLGAERAREELGEMIEYLIQQVDIMEGDPDLEDGGDTELSGDEHGDPSWCEWHALPASTRRTGKLNSKPLDVWRGVILEDEEEDDAPEEDDHSGQCTEDEISSGLGHWGFGVGAQGAPGCAISDPDTEHDTMHGGGSAEFGQERWLEVSPYYQLAETEIPAPEGDLGDRAIMRRTLKRIREERCQRVKSAWGGYAFRLRHSPFRSPGCTVASNLN